MCFWRLDLCLQAAAADSQPAASATRGSPQHTGGGGGGAAPGAERSAQPTLRRRGAIPGISPLLLQVMMMMRHRGARSHRRLASPQLRQLRLLIFPSSRLQLRFRV
jgi:hypothetical protein